MTFFEPAPLSFQWADPVQMRIYRRLKLIGEGPAAFYLDACRIMAMKPPFEATTHLVGHMLREVESALHDALEPMAERLPSSEAGIGNTQDHQEAIPPERYKDTIRAILRGLNIDESAPLAKRWLRVAGNGHRWAHRKNLERPRPVDAAFQTYWQEITALYREILDIFEAHYLLVHRFVDEQLFNTSTSLTTKITVLNEHIPHTPVGLGYVFERLSAEQNIEWLPPLRKAGYFLHPPEPEPDEEKDGLIYRMWPASRYLAKVASLLPREALSIVRDVIPATQNFLVYEDLLEVACQVPPAIAKGMLQKVKLCLTLTMQGQLPPKIGKLIMHLVQGGETEAAFELLSALLTVLPTMPVYYDRWRYHQMLREQTPLLIRAAGVEALLRFCHLLEAHLQDTSSRGVLLGEYSSRWRPTIEDREQNHPEELWGVQDILISLVRDAAQQMIADHKRSVEEVVSLLEGFSDAIFQRIIMYLLSLVPAVAVPIVVKYLTDPHFFYADEFRHEYTLLAQAGFDYLSSAEQEQILNWIALGPRVEEQAIELDETPQEQQSTDVESQQALKLWQRDWLACLSPVLPPQWQEQLAQLVAEFGVADHPDLPHIVQIRTWDGPPAPEFAQDLPAKSVTEIVAFLVDQSWQLPSAEVLASILSPVEGVRQKLISAVQADPTRFAQAADQLREVHPRYLNGILSGFEQALIRKIPFPWSPVLDLCLWILAEARQSEEAHGGKAEQDPTWLRACCKTIVNLLYQGFESHGAIPLALQQKLWEVIEGLTTDQDPTPAREAAPHYASINELVGLALNTIRGEALHATILYAWWWQRHPEQQGKEEERAAQGLDALSQVRKVLEQHLNPLDDPSLAIRSIYGSRFSWLAVLDRRWTARHISSIFPEEASLQNFWQAAWEAYVVYSRPSPLALELLHEVYQRAIERLSVAESLPEQTSHPIARQDSHNPDVQLGNHILIAYTEGYLAFDDPDSLLTLFFARAPDEIRGPAIAAIGKWLYRTSLASREVEDAQLERLQSLWERRLEEVKTAMLGRINSQELAAFGWWFSAKVFPDAAWALAQVEQTLQLLREQGGIEAASHVVERLAELSDVFPLKTMKCLALMERGGRVGWGVPEEYEHMRTILVNARKSGAEAWTIGQALINRLEAYGTKGFKELLE